MMVPKRDENATPVSDIEINVKQSKTKERFKNNETLSRLPMCKHALCTE